MTTTCRLVRVTVFCFLKLYIAGSQDDQIAAFDATMANIPYATGYNPKAWSQMTDVLIPKKSHSSLVEKLRIIVLFHAMFNMNNKRVGQEMVANAERLKQIPWEVYGGRKRHRANRQPSVQMTQRAVMIAYSMLSLAYA